MSDSFSSQEILPLSQNTYMFLKEHLSMIDCPIPSSLSSTDDEGGHSAVESDSTKQTKGKVCTSTTVDIPSVSSNNFSQASVSQSVPSSLSASVFYGVSSTSVRSSDISSNNFSETAIPQSVPSSVPASVFYGISSTTVCSSDISSNNFSHTTVSQSVPSSLPASGFSGASSTTIHISDISSNNFSQISVPQSVPSSVPASESWPGPYDFNVFFNSPSSVNANVNWVFNHNKLFAKKDVSCPVSFSTKCMMPTDVYIRTTPIFSALEQVNENVTRCVHHAIEDIKQGVFEAEHIVRISSNSATYYIDSATKRHSVTVPFENPSVGQHYSTYIYKFMCFTSCSGGPNRRPMKLVFTLEQGNHVLGRHIIDLKVCANPVRDMLKVENEVTEIKTLKRKETVSQQKHSEAPEKKKKGEQSGGKFTIRVQKKEAYDFLKQLKQAYDIFKFRKALALRLSSSEESS